MLTVRTLEIKTLADLKRHLQPGVKLKLAERHGEPIPDNAQLRTVIKAQSDSVCFRTADGQESWLQFQKASAYSFDSTGFRVLGLRYEYVIE